MAGSALAAGVLVVAAALSLGLAAVGGASVTAQRAAGAADAAALAAADAASGAVPTDDEPCALAARVAGAAGATLTGCALEGFVATVEVQAAYAGLAAVSRARAGPPEGQ
ncbi:helicase [Microbacterium sp. MYb66]|jgi:secretion/DNA translocation related TadE-like protein|uniref:helicase n=1 Tax=Microbacterium sp. MYb66 TaxID=1848692 RepID=UPI000CFFC727|nr:helicase [Microbacterium sp. MYb66]PRA80773.1 helicase [Microbacterium sp. MYb66]